MPSVVVMHFLRITQQQVSATVAMAMARKIKNEMENDALKAGNDLERGSGFLQKRFKCSRPWIRMVLRTEFGMKYGKKGNVRLHGMKSGEAIMTRYCDDIVFKIQDCELIHTCRQSCHTSRFYCVIW